MNLRVGQIVDVRNDEGGVFVGMVSGFINRDIVIITPNDASLRNWMPGGYTLGSVHWGSKLTVHI